MRWRAARDSERAPPCATIVSMGREEDEEQRAIPVTDHDQFVTLVEQHTGLLLKVTSALVGFDEAEDAAQEAVLRAWKARASLRDPNALRSWLLQIGVNVCRQWQRDRLGTQRRIQQPLTDETDDLLATLDADPGTTSYAATLDLRQAINELETEQRLIVVLRYYAGMDATEIGVALGKPPATIRTRLRRALYLLRQRLRDSGHLRATRPHEGDTHV